MRSPKLQMHGDTELTRPLFHRVRRIHVILLGDTSMHYNSLLIMFCTLGGSSLPIGLESCSETPNLSSVLTSRSSHCSRSFRPLLLLCCLIALLKLSLQGEQIDNIDAYQNFTLWTLGRFAIAQMGHASESDILPSGSAPNIQPLEARSYKIKRCKRVNVDKCVNAGRSSSCSLSRF